MLVVPGEAVLHHLKVYVGTGRKYRPDRSEDASVLVLLRPFDLYDLAGNEWPSATFTTRPWSVSAARTDIVTNAATTQSHMALPIVNPVLYTHHLRSAGRNLTGLLSSFLSPISTY